MAPAIALASKGFPVSYAFAEQLRGSRSLLRDPESVRVWLKGGTFYQPGDLLVLPDLGRVFRDIHERTGLRQALEFYVFASPSIEACVFPSRDHYFVLLSSSAIENL